MTEKNAVAALTEIVVELADMIERENAALAEYRLEVTREIRDGKTNLTRLYEQHVQALAASPALLEGVPPEAVVALQTAGKRLDAVGVANGRLVSAAMEANQRLIKAVINAVKDRNDKAATAYGRRGRMEGAKEKSALSVTFNEKL